MNFPLSLRNFPRPLLLAVAFCAPLDGQMADFDAPPISYASTPSKDLVARLAKRLEAGEARLQYEKDRGYLAALLRELGVPISSQVLVFSKTSFQRDLISPDAPRAVYFNDEVYVGSVRYGPLLELAAMDPELGSVFYTMTQDPTKPPKIQRHNAECTQCHASALTKGVPGVFVRSVYSDPAGQPVLKAGTFLTDHTSPFKERWGGWYVTGTHGAERHMGNAFLRSASGEPSDFDASRGANWIDLKPRCSLEGYLSPHSDIVALMVLEHQTQLHNLLTAASYQSRLALRDESAIREMMKEPPGPPTESTKRRFQYLTESLLKYMLFIDEAPLSSAIVGTSKFAEEFSALGPRDSKGRSLRDFDLTQRLFRYPLSFMIYSDSIGRFPSAFREYFYQRLLDVLSGKDTGRDFVKLTERDRTALLEILRETKKDPPAAWWPAQPGPAASSNATRARL